MTRAISPDVKELLTNARNLEGAAALIASGQSTFGKWCLPGFLPQQGTAVLYGQSGSAKSFFAVHLALRMAAGLSWFGSKVKKGTVVYLATEDRAGIEARAVAAALHMDDLHMRDLSLEFLTPPSVHSDAWLSVLIEALTEIQVRNDQPIVAVFLDTLGAAFGGRSQDDAAQMTVATDAIEAVAEHFKCLFLSIHHSGKDQYRGMRGSQVLKDRSDTVITTSVSKSGIITATIQKQRNGALGAPITFRLAPVQIPMGDIQIDTCVIADLSIGSSAGSKAKFDIRPEEDEPQPSPRKLPRDTQTALKALKSLANGAGTSIDAWRAAAYEAFGDRDKDAKRQAFNTAKKRLLADSHITITEDGVSFLA
jgi:hypothetical protein